MTDPRRGDERVGDPAVDTAWHRASDEEPPTRVDDAILAAARAEVRAVTPRRPAPRHASWWVRWQPLAAAAGVVGLAFVLVQLMPREEATRSPAAVRAPQGPGTDAAKAAPEADVAAPQTTPPTPPAASHDSAVKDATGAAAESRAAPTGVGPSQAARSITAPVSPESRARRVAELHAQGELAAAAAELRAFRQAFPDADAYLPPSLLPWAASVPGADPP